MWHTDPTFRGLLLSLAADPPDPAALPALVDWLEEAGDPRGGRVPEVLADGFMGPARPDGMASIGFQAIPAVLALFPEGPRWDSQTGPPGAHLFRTKRDAGPHAFGPLWPDPPAPQKKADEYYILD